MTLRLADKTPLLFQSLHAPFHLENLFGDPQLRLSDVLLHLRTQRLDLRGESLRVQPSGDNNHDQASKESEDCRHPELDRLAHVRFHYTESGRIKCPLGLIYLVEPK